MPAPRQLRSRHPHVLFDISAHGLGHLAQSAPVIGALIALQPDVRLTIRSGLADEVLRRRIQVPCDTMATSVDFGLHMKTSFEVDVGLTARHYNKIHQHFSTVTAALAADFERRNVDLVVSNIGYLSLAAAHIAGMRSVAFSSINWHDVVRHYCGGEAGIGTVLADIARCYRDAGVLLRLEPGTAMAEFATETVAELIVAVGVDRRQELRERLGLPNATLTVAFSFTDRETHPPPVLADFASRPLVCLGPRHWAGARPWVSFETAGLSFLDLVRSSDLIVAKPGYGIVTEAAAAGTPCLLVPRDDWPETTTTSDWQRRYGLFETTSEPLDRLTAAGLVAVQRRLSSRQAESLPQTNGAQRVAEAIAAML